MIPVVDSTCLIYLARARQLNLLRAIYKRVAIPRAVYGEVVLRGKEKRFIDAEIVEKAVKGGLIEVKTLPKAQLREAKRLCALATIGRGEAEAIVLARGEGSSLIVDDSAALRVAEMYEVETLRTTSLILKAVGQGILTKRDARKTLEKFVAAGYRLRGEVLLELLRELE